MAFSLISQSPDHEFTVTVNDVGMEKVSCYRYLGIDFDETLTFGEQTKKAITKTKQGIGMLCRSLRKWASANIINTAISTIALPALVYGIEVWFPPDSSRQIQIIKAQKYAARLVLNDFRKEISNKELTRKLNWQPIHHMVAVRRLCRVKQYLDGTRHIEPEIFSLAPEKSTRSSSRLTEQKHNVQLLLNTRRKMSGREISSRTITKNEECPGQITGQNSLQTICHWREGRRSHCEPR